MACHVWYRNCCVWYRGCHVWRKTAKPCDSWKFFALSRCHVKKQTNQMKGEITVKNYRRNRTETLSLRLTAEEKQVLKALAEKRNLSMTDYILLSALHYSAGEHYRHALKTLRRGPCRDLLHIKKVGCKAGFYGPKASRRKAVRLSHCFASHRSATPTGEKRPCFGAFRTLPIGKTGQQPRWVVTPFRCADNPKKPRVCGLYGVTP